MICEECNERPATMHFTKIINGKKTEVHMCERCAQEKGEMFMLNGGPGFSINNLLAGLFNIDPGFQQAKANALPKTEVLRCIRCNLTFSQFVHIGKFGCAECYETFKDHLDPILKRVHSGNTSHHGKIPKRIGGSIHIKKQIKDLKQQLKQFIEHEEFEKAAEIRDQVRSLEKGADNVEGGGQQ
ncbi:UvrB/UvrC motif-containing protein [Peribacillus glennii]|uniref:UVR domain-containing protein n=1 Tax=Peribacillus glennii TaxID=2303991 RepID=A0A372L8G2_9BACI|nr:UvrB/UvrC motif-containing protein [Peribacillus glennii]RFU61368.1 hypothetical protein D0466_17955 [Peribacillus glennii]